jgi:imidazolonepropionase-like amidohydrolase
VHLTLAGRPRDNAAATLQAGFTTVADLGSAGGAGLRLKRLIEQDSAAGPHMIAAGSWIGGRGGVCEFGGATIRGADEARSRAQADVAAGARMLKLCITGWLDPSVQNPDSVELTASEIAAIADVARTASVPLVAHAIGARGADAAMRAGVKLLAHTPVVSAAQAQELARANVCVATTITTLQQGTAAAALRASFQLLRSAGVRLIVGTDAGVLPHGRNADELVTLQQLGMPARDVLRAATTVAADCLGLPSYGDVTPGAPADLIAVRGDPRTDISLLRAPVWVMKSGRVRP